MYNSDIDKELMPKRKGGGQWEDRDMPSSNQSMYESSVVELKFRVTDGEFFLAAVSQEGECEFELETVIPRSDGTVLEFLTMYGIEPSKALQHIRNSPGIQEAELLHEEENQAFFEVISTSRIAMALADEEALLKRIVVSGGEGYITAEVPTHIDVSNVISSFLVEYPNAELISRKESKRQAPLLSESQFMAGLLEELTEKQLRALRVAHANGYFEFPRQHNADEIANILGVSTPTFSQHLRVAERKLLNKIF